MRRLIVVAFLAAGCGSSSPTAPTPATPAPAPVPVPTVITLTGAVSATNGGQPLSGLTLALGTLSATTDARGAFAVTIPLASVYPLSIAGPTIVPRGLRISITGSRTVPFDAISLSSGFDLAFYRALIRNGFESATLEPLRRWTRTPQIYLKTVDEGGEAIHGPTLDLIEATVKAAVPEWTSGALGTPTVTRGTETRVGTAGWITIRFPVENTITLGYCGRAQVGTEGGYIELGYHVPPTGALGCRTATSVVAPRTVRHELGHALGFWHTSATGDLMSAGTWTDGDAHPTARELSHATIAYRRPVGNVDPDVDPVSVVTLAAARVVQ